MKKSWFIGLLVVVSVVMVFIMFNNQSGKDAVPLSEIFPDEEVVPVDVEYEFVQEGAANSGAQEVVSVPAIEAKLPAATVETKEADVPIKEITSQGTEANFTVQIASFKDRKQAEEALTRIRKNVPSAYISERNLGDKGIWYRIYAGRFNLRSEAEVSLSDIKRNYNDSFIVSPKKVK
jgi:cell division septation protein DedD